MYTLNLLKLLNTQEDRLVPHIITIRSDLKTLFGKLRLMLTPFFLAVMMVLPLVAGPIVSAAPTIKDTHYAMIKNALFAQPYDELPQYKVSAKLFGKSGDRPDNRLFAAAKRTLTNPDDWIDFPHGQKLFNANGICFVGEWHIDSPSIYTGLFANGARSPVIARASVALSGTKQKHKRAFGIAIKLFPAGTQQTLNVFTMNSLAGVRAQHVLDLPLDNQPALGGLPPISKISTLLRINRDLQRADRISSKTKANVAYRPINLLAEVAVNSTPTSPTWLRLTALNSERVDAKDFRDELRVEQYSSGKLEYKIEVASGEVGNKASAQWQSLGSLTLSQSVTSAACDKNLHFAHPTLSSGEPN